MKRVLEICVAEDVPPEKVCKKVPQAVKTNAVFVIDLQVVDYRDLTADDNGIYGTHSSPSERARVKLTEDGRVESVATLGRRDSLEEYSSEEDVFTIRRQ